jgi:hypothetical protein
MQLIIYQEPMPSNWGKRAFIVAAFLLLSFVFFNIPALEGTRFLSKGLQPAVSARYTQK